VTAPITQGYTDYGRYSARASKLYVNDDNVALNFTVIRGPFFVADIPYLAFLFDSFGTTVNFTMEYYLDSSLNIALGSQDVECAVDGGFDYSLPVQGPWVRFLIDPVSATGTYSLKVYEVAGPLANLRGSASNNILVATNSSVGAGATQTFASTRTVPGEAHWFTESAVATWTSRVESVDALGVTTIIDEIRQVAAGDKGRQIFLPSTPCQIVITNSSAGAGTFRAALVARPIEAGR
jgi:hypothetical protein